MVSAVGLDSVFDCISLSVVSSLVGWGDIISEENFNVNFSLLDRFELMYIWLLFDKLPAKGLSLRQVLFGCSQHHKDGHALSVGT